MRDEFRCYMEKHLKHLNSSKWTPSSFPSMIESFTTCCSLGDSTPSPSVAMEMSGFISLIPLPPSLDEAQSVPHPISMERTLYSLTFLDHILLSGSHHEKQKSCPHPSRHLHGDPQPYPQDITRSIPTRGLEIRVNWKEGKRWLPAVAVIFVSFPLALNEGMVAPSQQGSKELQYFQFIKYQLGARHWARHFTYSNQPF